MYPRGFAHDRKILADNYLWTRFFITSLYRSIHVFYNRIHYQSNAHAVVVLVVQISIFIVQPPCRGSVLLSISTRGAIFVLRGRIQMKEEQKSALLLL